jgi:threonine dehydrogenase-like Zn-dependent dehydrogenase
MTSDTVPAEMDAAVLRRFGELTVQRVPVPQPGPGEILCRVRACGICGTDVKIVAGDYRGTWPPSLPFIIGHEWSGEVAALGPDTERSGLAIGDRVVAENHTGCGACPMCRAGRYNLCERVREPGFKLYGHTAPGALAEYAVRPAVALHRVPPEVSDVAAALVNQGALTVHAARRARLEAGSSVAVFGPGLLGLAGGRSAELPVDPLVLDELNVLGVRSSPNAYPAMIELLASGAVVTGPLTAHQYSLRDAAAAFAALASREAIRPIITMTHQEPAGSPG